MTVLAEIDQTGVSPNHSGRYGGRVRLFVLHTQEGPGDAFSLAKYLQNPSSQVSYHYSVDDRNCVAVVDTDRSSWSVLDANGYSVNLCFAGSRASQSREVWLSNYRNAIDTAAWLFVRDSRKYGNPDPRTISHAEIRAGKAGGTDHYGITKGLQIGNHTDVGPNFPWDVFNEDVERHKKGGVGPVTGPSPAELIQRKRNEAPWLGNKLTPEPSRPCPDKRGHYAFYENGAIYWTQTGGARPIPNSILVDWGALGYEGSKVGYPITYHTILKGPDGKPWGEVQGFEFGAIYRKYAYKHAISIWGEIRKLWADLGYENGKLGWPTSEEKGWARGTFQNFEGGKIYWIAKGNATIAFDNEGNPL
jgi:hypothetical protein